MAKGGTQQPMADKYSGPYKGWSGATRRGSSRWEIKIEVVSQDRQKPHLGRAAPEAVVPPRSGRPRAASVAPVASSSCSSKKPADTRIYEV